MPGGIFGRRREEAAGRNLEDADRVLFDDGQPRAARRHRDVRGSRRHRRAVAPRLSAREASDPDVVWSSLTQMRAFRPRRRRSVAGERDRALAPRAGPDEAPGSHVVEERSSQVHAAPRIALDRDPASPGSGRLDPDLPQVLGLGRQEPAHGDERETREREEQDPEHGKTRAASPDRVHPADRDLRAAGREEGGGGGGQRPEGDPQGQDGGVREDERHRGGPHRQGPESEASEVPGDPDGSRAEGEARDVAQREEDEHGPGESDRHVPDQAIGAGFTPPGGEVQEPGGKQDDDRREDDLEPDARELSGPDRAASDRAREVEAQALFREIAADHRGAEEQRNRRGKGDGKEGRRVQTRLRRAETPPEGEERREERKQRENRRRREHAAPLGDLPAGDREESLHRAPPARAARAVAAGVSAPRERKISSSDMAEASASEMPSIPRNRSKAESSKFETTAPRPQPRTFTLTASKASSSVP